MTSFLECQTCAAKPGSPTLCASCLNNRALESERDVALAEATAARRERDAARIGWANGCNQDNECWPECAALNADHRAPILAEREACALVAEGFDVRVIDPLGRSHRVSTGLEAIAAAIRARGGA